MLLVVLIASFFWSQGSEVAYIYGCIVLCFVPILAVLAAYGVVKLMNARRRRMKQIRENLRTNNNDGEEKKVSDKMHVKEWLHENARRPVKVGSTGSSITDS